MDRHVVVVSVDGMGARSYATPSPDLHIPNLRWLKEGGSFAEGVVGVYPTVTYPSHTTIVTGRLPAEHGIHTNLSSREAGKNTGDWFWFSKAIKAPTLWDEARRARLSTASVSWPVTVGAAIDWNIPEIWDPLASAVGDPLYMAKFMNPALSLELLTAVGPPEPGTDGDTQRIRLAAYFLKRHRPNLLLIHLGNLDQQEHGHGPQSPEARTSLERMDALIGELRTAIKDAGLEDSTDLFIVSDHGFLSVDRAVAPNVLLVKAGLLQTDGQGRITGGKVATVANGGSFFIYWPEAQDLRPQVEAALKPLVGQGLAWAVFGPQALKEMGADPGARLALEAADRVEFVDGVARDLVVRKTAPGGAHGFLPFRKGLEASFIAWGPRIKAKVNLHRIPMTAIGPTLLKDLGIEDSQFGSEKPLDDIFK